MVALRLISVTVVVVYRFLLCGGGQLGLGEPTCVDAGLRGEGDCDGLLEHLGQTQEDY